MAASGGSAPASDPDATPLASATEPGASAPPPDAHGATRPPPPAFKPGTMLLVFLFTLGIIMIFDGQTRLAIATLLGFLLVPAIGFGYQYVLATMFCAALIEMALTALAYNWATDWIKTSRTQSWASAFRKVQMEALRSGKKDRVDALKPHQAEITRLSSELSISQMKGMAVTWFLVIAIYTWVGIFIAAAPAVDQTVNVGGSAVDIAHSFQLGPFPIPFWIVLFSLYTFPLSYVLRRSLKHYSLRRWELAHDADVLGAPSGPSA